METAIYVAPHELKYIGSIRFMANVGPPDEAMLQYFLKVSMGLYLEGQGDLVTRLIRGRTRVTIWVIGVINLLTKSP